MECHGDDLSTLQELTDASLLSCLEDRHMRGVQQATIGHCVSVHLSPNSRSIPSHANKLAADILHNLTVSHEDQCVLVLGASNRKATIFKSILGSIFAQAKSDLSDSLMKSVQLLSLLVTHQDVMECLLAVSVYVNTITMEITGAHFSCMLLNSSSLAQFEVLSHVEVVSDKLARLGLPLSLKEGYLSLLGAIQQLVRGEAGDLGVEISPESNIALAQQLYSYLVTWTVDWLNTQFGPQDGGSCVLCVSQPSTTTDKGSLSQLVANYCSETLHNLYCQRLFVWEQEQYSDEGVDWDPVSVELNQTLLDTFNKNGGLLQSLALEDSQDITTALASCLDNSGDTCYQSDADKFVVSHFTGEQVYNVTDQWPTENQLHCVSRDIITTLSKSTNQIIRELSKLMTEVSPDVLLPDHPSSCPTHLLTQRAQLCMSMLSEEVTLCHPQFLLTINTGQSDKDVGFDPTYVLTQLQHLRVLDTALIQSCGYPVRMSHDQFIASYSSLLIGGARAQSTKDTCSSLIQASQLDDCLVGRTQVLLKPWHLSQLQEALIVFQTSARKLQQAFRRSYSRRNSDKMRMEKALSMIRQPRISEESDDSCCSSPTGVFSPPPSCGSPEHLVTSSPQRVTSGDAHVIHTRSTSLPTLEPLDYSTPVQTMRGPQSVSSVPPNSPASQPHPPLPARPHLSPPQMPLLQASPVSPKSPAMSGKTGRKKRSWGKDTRASSQSPVHVRTASPASQDHTSHSWFHGMVSRAEAELLLRSFNCDCFLIRESQNRSGEHSLSLTHKNKVKHFRIDSKVSGDRTRYELFGATRSFLRLSELVDYYSQHCMSADGEVLVTPCPKDPHDGLSDLPPPLPPPRKSNLSLIKRPQTSIKKLHSNRPKAVRRSATEEARGPAPPLRDVRPQSMQQLYTHDISDESISLLQKELDIEQRIMEGARRLADMPCNKKERQRRKQSLVQAQSRLLLLRQQYHTVQERRRFIEMSMNNLVTSPTRDSPLPPLPPPRGP